jgi:hypothetical protein
MALLVFVKTIDVVPVAKISAQPFGIPLFCNDNHLVMKVGHMSPDWETNLATKGKCAFPSLDPFLDKDWLFAWVHEGHAGQKQHPGEA